MKTLEAMTPSSTISLDQAVSCVPVRVARQAATYPTALAVAADGMQLTYSELDRRAGSLAGRLRLLGVGRDVVVGLYLPRSPEMVIGALAILKAGGAYLPLDPAYPADRLEFMLDDAQAPVLVSSSVLADRLSGRQRNVVCVDACETVEGSTAPLPEVVSPGALAYVIYTSGSTGTPKGVELTHANLANLVDWHNQAFGITAADRASHIAGLSFDAAVWELWPYLSVGASVHLADDETRNSAELLRDWLLAQHITVGFVPTPLAEQLLMPDIQWPRNPSLRQVLTGGDALHRYPPPDLPFVLVNNYGPTECTVVATSGRVLPNPTPDMPPSIGTAITNARVHILDEALNPVAPGASGEIYVGGAGVARGYRNRPELTAQRFIPDPFSVGGKLYKTGDLGRERADGQISFLGRTDDQIKIRGYRIEPSEISAALDRHPEVRASLIMAREDTPGDKRLVGYVVLNEAADLTHRGLRDYLRSFLPEYMLPAAFVRVTDFPLTSHGKIDRTALPVPSAENTVDDEISDGPRSTIEQRIADILGELLNLDEIGVDDNFFLLGGHSLLGAQLMARLREGFGVEIGLRSLFQAPTVSALALEVERLGGTKEPVPTPVSD